MKKINTDDLKTSFRFKLQKLYRGKLRLRNFKLRKYELNLNLNVINVNLKRCKCSLKLLKRLLTRLKSFASEADCKVAAPQAGSRKENSRSHVNQTFIEEADKSSGNHPSGASISGFLVFNILPTLLPVPVG